VLSARLGAGDRLVVIVALTDLERLLRRQPLLAEYGVIITGFPLPARAWLVGLIRTITGANAEEAEREVSALPLRLAGSFTRGEAEDLLAQLTRERVGAKLCRDGVA
jgi:hypothetical protein